MLVPILVWQFITRIIMPMLYCPLDWNTLQVQENFDFDQYMGRWYEISYFDPEEQPGSKWIMDNLYYVYDATSRLNARATMVGTMRSDGVNATCFHRDGKGFMQLNADPKNPAKMIHKISRSGKFPDSHYYVLATDYDNYAFVAQCPVNKLKGGVCEGGTKFNIFSREKTSSATGRMRILDEIEDSGLCVDHKAFLTVKFNQDCPLDK